MHLLFKRFKYGLFWTFLEESTSFNTLQLIYFIFSLYINSQVFIKLEYRALSVYNKAIDDTKLYLNRQLMSKYRILLIFCQYFSAFFEA